MAQRCLVPLHGAADISRSSRKAPPSGDPGWRKRETFLPPPPPPPSCSLSCDIFPFFQLTAAPLSQRQLGKEPRRGAPSPISCRSHIGIRAESRKPGCHPPSLPNLVVASAGPSPSVHRSPPSHRFWWLLSRRRPAVKSFHARLSNGFPSSFRPPSVLLPHLSGAI